MTNWQEFATHMLDEEWLKANPPWPVGRVPRDEAEAERRYWPWPLSADDQAQMVAEGAALGVEVQP